MPCRVRYLEEAADLSTLGVPKQYMFMIIHPYDPVYGFLQFKHQLLAI